MNGPILALDIDGVLNRLRPVHADEDSTWESRTVEVLLKDVPHSPFHRRQATDIPDWPVTVNPTLHAPWLQALRTVGVEIVWATTWEAQANICFAPFYDLPDLPVACSVATTPPLPYEDTPDWKARGLEAYAGSRPLIWLDDMNLHYAALTMESHKIEQDSGEAYEGFMGEAETDFWGLQNRHAALYVDPREGITEAIMRQVNILVQAWVL